MRCAAFIVLAATACPSLAQLSPEWIAQLPSGVSLNAGLQGMVTDDAGRTFFTSITGPSWNTDVFVAGFDTDGELMWSDTYNGPEDWHDQARGIAIGADGLLYVCGNTPGVGRYADVLVLKYDPETGARLGEIQYTSAPGKSELGASVAADRDGNIYVGGGTVGDSADTLLVSFDASGELRWRQQWDGPAFAPYSQDHIRQIGIAPDGGVVAMIHGVWNSNHPDYVIIKYEAETGAVIWETNWGVNGGDFATDMVFDSDSNVYVTGTGIDFQDRYATIKLRGDDGSLAWQAYDGVDFHNSARAIALDGAGGVYITGHVDPDGDRSNGNGDMYTVKRDASSGAFRWSHRYGDACRGCGDSAGDIAVDSEGHVLLVGTTNSAPYSHDLILFVLDDQGGFETRRGVVGAGPDESADGFILQFDSSENIYVGGGYSSLNTGAQGTAVFKFASLTPPACAPDLTGDGVVDTNDFFLFLTLYQDQDPVADFAPGGGVNTNDFFAYLVAYQRGC